MSPNSCRTNGGISVHLDVEVLPSPSDMASLAAQLDRRRGAVLCAGLASRPDIGFVDPPLAVTVRGSHIVVEALNARGGVLIPSIAVMLYELDVFAELRAAGRRIAGRLNPANTTSQVIDALTNLLCPTADPNLRLYSAFGCDGGAETRDAVLYLPDEILVADHATATARILRYDFVAAGRSTRGLPRTTAPAPYVSSHTAPSKEPPSEIFRQLRMANPAAYGALMNLGRGEFLMAATRETASGPMLRLVRMKNGIAEVRFDNAAIMNPAA
ncbi:hypothetical protein LVJ94_03240 [Pendulispora rubella]|uniref:Uncharacterized protein n=1 Tax=Pendulispora rubella TaxID=2741070 RepID=A0ABZ2L5Q0_9BACT